MLNQPNVAKVIPSATISEYFKDAILSAMAHQHVKAQEETIVYIINLLVTFARSDNIYEQTPDGKTIKPLALLYCDAISARTVKEKNLKLQRLGDIALFISGLYANSLNRSLVGIDYFIAMGGGAYSFLADTARSSSHSDVIAQVFAELSERFTVYVDVLTEVGEQSELSDASDILRLYETWLKTGSDYAANRLQELGINTQAISKGSH